ncbi:MAG: hypothetical protein KDJ52_04975 [Anaerolineae bacterium]|nr:hypothetical protein [Anaerolineae bacterium]
MPQIGKIEISEDIYGKLLKSAVAASIDAQILYRIGDKLPDELRTKLEAQVESDYCRGDDSYVAALVRIHTSDFERDEFQIMQTPLFKETWDILENKGHAIAFQLLPPEIRVDQMILNSLGTHFQYKALDSGRE